MTVSKFFGILFKIILYPYILYWTLPLYFFNERNASFKDLWEQESYFYNVSFILFVCFMLVMTFCFIIFSFRNSHKALTIVFSPRYLIDNFWDDVNKEFSSN